MANLVDILDALPEALHDCMQSFGEEYSAAIAEAKNEKFVIVAGRAGSGKSTLINAVSGALSLLSACGSAISQTMVPTRIKAAQPRVEKFTLRVVHAVHNESWSKIRKQALKRLEISLAAVFDEDDKTPLMSHLKDQSIMNVLRSVYPVLNPACSEVLEWASTNLPGVLLCEPLQTAEKFIKKLESDDEFDIDGVKHFYEEEHSEQIVSDLSAEEAALLLRLIGHNHSTRQEVFELLVCRYLMSAPSAYVDIAPLIAQFQKEDPAIEEEQFAESFALARSLSTKGIVFPKDILNLWPLIEYFEVSGPFAVPGGVVVVDTAGSQDSNQLNDPLESAKNSTRCKEPHLWYLIHGRVLSTDGMFNEVSNINRLFDWRNVNFIITMDDERKAKTPLENEVRTKIAAQLSENPERAQHVKVFAVSSRAFAAIEDPSRFSNIGADQLKPYKKLSPGIKELRDSLRRDNRGDDAKVHADYAKKLANVLNFTQNLDTNVTETPELENVIENLSQLQSDTPQHIRVALQDILNKHKKNMHARCEYVRTNDFAHELKTGLALEIKDISHYTQLDGLAKGRGDFDLYACKNVMGKPIRLARWLGRFVDRKSAVLHNLSELFIVTATQEVCKFLEQAQQMLQEGKQQLDATKDGVQKTSQLFRLVQAQSFFKSFEDIRSELVRHLQLPVPESTASGLENKAALRAEYVAMWSQAEQTMKSLKFHKDIVKSKKEALTGYLTKHLPDILYKTLLRIQNVHVNATYSAVVTATEAFLESVDVEWQLCLKMKPASLKMEADLYYALKTQLAEFSGNTVAPVYTTFETQNTDEAMSFLSSKKRKIQEETKAIFNPGDGLISIQNENEPHTIQLGGINYLLLFRGLCAAITDDTHFGENNDGLVSALGQSVQGALRDEKYYSTSGFVMVEHQLRKKFREKNTTQLIKEETKQSESSIQTQEVLRKNEETKEIEEIGDEVRQDVLECSGKSFSSLIHKIGMRSTLICQSLAYFNSKKTDFECFRYATQQIYSNDDQQFMRAYAYVAEEVFKTAKSTELNIPALADRATALKESVRSKKRLDYLKLEAWSWLGKLKYLVPRHACAEYLHGNPYVSLTDNLQHAIRYATGQKKYMQGREQQLALDLPYGLNETTGKYIWAKANDLPPSKEGIWMGVLILVLVPEAYYQNSSSIGFCNNIPALHSGGKLLINSRILWEREITFIGCLPAGSITQSWPIPLLSLSMKKCGKDWDKYFNISSEDEGCFVQLKNAISSLVKARERNHSSFTLVARAREALVNCLTRRIKHDLSAKYPKADLDYLFKK